MFSKLQKFMKECRRLTDSRRWIDFSQLVSDKILFVLGFEKNLCRPFIVGGQQVGLIRPDVMVELMKYPQVFFIHDVPTNDKKFEVCLTLLSIFRSFTDYKIVTDNSRTESSLQGLWRTNRASGLDPSWYENQGAFLSSP